MNLWLPADYIRRRHRQRRSGRLTFVTWSDVAGISLSDNELRALAATLCGESVLALVGAISAILANAGWGLATLATVQQSAARELSPRQVASKVERLLSTCQRDVVVHEAQLLAVAKLAVLHGQPGPVHPPSANELDTLGKLLLGVNDALGREEQAVGGRDELAVMLALRRLALLRNEQLRYVVPRYFDLLVTRAQHHPVASGFDAAFRSATGLGLDEYLAFAMLALAPFATLTGAAGLHGLGYLSALEQLERQVPDQNLLARARALLSDDVAGFAAAFGVQAAGAAVQTAGYLPFRRHPLVRLSGRAAAPISLPLLQEKASTGAYWILHEHYRKADPKEGVRTFTAAMGSIFQEYLTALLQRTFAGQPNRQRFYDEDALKASSPNAARHRSPPFDGLIVGPTSLVIVEMSTAAFTTAALDSGDLATFGAEARRKFVPKIAQVNEAFHALAAGRWTPPNLDRTEIVDVFPVLALLHPFPQTEATLAPLRAAAHSAGKRLFGEQGHSVRIHLPQLITAEEWEMLEPLLSSGQHTLPELLRGKLDAPDTAVVSLKTYLLNMLRLNEQANPHMEALYRALVGRITHILGAAPPPAP